MKQSRSLSPNVTGDETACLEGQRHHESGLIPWPVVREALAADWFGVWLLKVARSAADHFRAQIVVGIRIVQRGVVPLMGDWPRGGTEQLRETAARYEREQNGSDKQMGSTVHNDLHDESGRNGGGIIGIQPREQNGSSANILAPRKLNRLSIVAA